MSLVAKARYRSTPPCPEPLLQVEGEAAPLGAGDRRAKEIALNDGTFLKERLGRRGSALEATGEDSLDRQRPRFGFEPDFGKKADDRT